MIIIGWMVVITVLSYSGILFFVFFLFEQLKMDEIKGDIINIETYLATLN